ncbi:transcriptional regulator with XRE-family HTH domain [Breznakia sp. PF5-3]|uniref:helix-turn-helix transcriptional regulator n=1 Tax=unclassified Breznakia TaxID=2623764 RepID=UPI002404F48D|nr:MULTISPECIES: helix-turn-helix transcriptional regulator [unclassified Breznakia]MDF9825002.1 transcriptional regulator with XRE-family HTH domain [Breznakia sp. PM6-1]MDF9835427.1 transcriptional regulator with XRE-family HTH domain [Breznakia sp. PF5-3]MDF9837659.1 transcriptional regulator with XRE-family HTH domain [Breznakia sp. PFB2-8]MDF9859523.1 transcriptional regulator with XRE-family HTH domain [Breznakia sp. PH5-24]
MEEFMMTLKACRVNANLKIKDVAKIVGKTERTIKNWESGRSIPNGIDLKKLAKLYNIPIDYIFLGDELTLSEYYNSPK